MTEFQMLLAVSLALFALGFAQAHKMAANRPRARQQMAHHAQQAPGGAQLL